MATAYTRKDGYSAVVVPSEEISPETWSGTAAGCPEAGPRPGQAVPDQAGTRMIVSTGGQQDDTVYRVRMQRGGYAGDAEFAWAVVTNGTTGTYRGCNLPNFAQDLRHCGVSLTGTTATPAVCTTGSGRVVVIWAELVVGTGVTVYASYSDDLVTWTGYNGLIGIWSEDPDSDFYTGVTTDSADCVAARWDADREVVQVWIRIEDPATGAGGGQHQFYLYESADEGETWDLVQRNVLAEPWVEDGTPRTPVIGKVAGTLVLLQPNDDVSSYVAQWVSSDHGRTFDLLRSDAHTYRQHRLCEHAGRLFLAAIEDTTDVCVVELQSAYDIVHDATLSSIGSPTASGSLSICSQHGRLYILCTGQTTNYSVAVRASVDGSDWDIIGHDLLSFEATGNHVDVDALACTPAEGGICLVMRLSDTGTDSDLRGRLFAMRCGGWATVTLPPTSSATIGPGRLSFGPANAAAGAYFIAEQVTWYPALLPDSLTYTTSGTGTAAIGLSAGDSPKMTITAAAGTRKYYEDHFTGDLTKGILVYFDMSVNEGGSITSNDSAVRLVLSDGVTEYNATIRISADDGITLKDNVGGASVSLGVLPGATTDRRACIAAIREIDPGTAAQLVVYLVRYSTYATDGHLGYTTLGSISLDPDGTPSADSYVQFGVIGAGSAVDIEQDWYAFHYIAVAGLGGIHDLAGSWSSPAMLGGAPASGIPTEIRGGLRVSFGGGPAKLGETYLIEPRHDYAVEHIYPTAYPSPREEYRSTADSAEVTLSWTWDSVNDWGMGLGSSTWVLALIGTNAHSFVWEGYTAASTWETILTIDSATEFASLPYRVPVHGSVRGPYVTVNTGGSGSASRYIHENELVGGTLVIGSNRHRIIRNTSGTWSTSVGKKPCIYVDPDGWDTATASTGTCSIWPPNVIAIKHGMGNTFYRRIRVRIPAQDTWSGDFRIGQMIMGGATVFGRKHSFGRTETMEPGGVVTDLAGGARASVVAAPPRYVHTFAWSDGFSTRQLYETALDPDYLTIGSSLGVDHAAATRDDAHTVLQGLVSRTDGAHVPVLWLPAIEYAGASTSQIITDPHLFCYGRVTSAVSLSMPIGTEGADEIVQVGEVRVEGER